jgi:hypothetical protein
MVFNRINVGGLTMLSTTGDSYIPSWMEIAISLGVVSTAILVFLFAFEHFNIWEKQQRHPESFGHTPPSFDYASAVWLGSPGIAALSKYSLAFVLSFALGMALMPGHQVRGEGIEDITVRPANGKDTLLINGNLDNFHVEFPHKEHIKRIGEDKCIDCHHLNLPRGDNNSCWECHTSMYKAVAFFKHDWHSFNKGGNIKCNDCHTPGQIRNAESAKKCIECHPQYDLPTSKKNTVNKYYALSYTDALHKSCVSCHMLKLAELKDKPHLAECATCHETELPQKLDKNLKWEITLHDFNRVILPLIDSVKIQGNNMPMDVEK